MVSVCSCSRDNSNHGEKMIIYQHPEVPEVGEKEYEELQKLREGMSEEDVSVRKSSDESR